MTLSRPSNPKTSGRGPEGRGKKSGCGARRLRTAAGEGACSRATRHSPPVLRAGSCLREHELRASSVRAWGTRAAARTHAGRTSTAGWVVDQRHRIAPVGRRQLRRRARFALNGRTGAFRVAAQRHMARGHRSSPGTPASRSSSRRPEAPPSASSEWPRQGQGFARAARAR